MPVWADRSPGLTGGFTIGGVLSSWPFGGREVELDRVRRLVSDPAAPGMVIAGPPGVGKSRLAAEALGGVDAVVVRVIATAAARELPFGALSQVLPDGGERLVLSVDDAHLLDAASAALLRRLAPRAFLLVTLRTGERLPEALPRLPERLDLGPLTAADTGRVLAAALPGPAAAELPVRLHALSGGNPLLLRETVDWGRRTSWLVQGAGGWEIGADAQVPRDLPAMIAARLAALEGPVRELAELVAFGEPVGAGVLSALAAPAVIEEALECGLVQPVDDGRRTYLRLAHPLYGEVLRAVTAAPLAARRRSQLAAAVEGLGARRREDPLRLAVWRVDSGQAGAPGPLVAGCRLAWAAHDLPLAIRLGEAAVAAGGGVEAAVALANVLMNANRHEEGEAALLAVWDRALDERDRVLLTTVRAGLLFGVDRVGDAGRLLEKSEQTIKDRTLRHELRVARGNLVTLAGQCRAGRAIMEGLLAEPDLAPAVAAQARAFRALALAHSGRAAEALSEADKVAADPAAWRDVAPFLDPVLALTRYAAALFRGDLAGAERAVAAVGADLEHWPPALVLFRAAQAALARLRGRPAEARRLADLPDDGPDRLLMPCLSELALAAILTGDVAAARPALAAADEQQAAFFGLLRHHTDLTRAWVVALSPGSGPLERAVDLALLAAERARAESLHGYEMAALHDVVRLGGAARAAERLGELAGLVDGDLAPLCAEHARAVVAGDGPALAGAAAEFERLGLILHAAEAYLEAAQASAPAEAGAALARARELAGRCEGARTPRLAALNPPPEP